MSSDRGKKLSWSIDKGHRGRKACARIEGDGRKGCNGIKEGGISYYVHTVLTLGWGDAIAYCNINMSGVFIIWPKDDQQSVHCSGVSMWKLHNVIYLAWG